MANALSQGVHKGANTIVLDHNQFDQMGPVDLVNEILAKAASFEGTSLLVLDGAALCELNLEMVYRLVPEFWSRCCFIQEPKFLFLPWLWNKESLKMSNLKKTIFGCLLGKIR